MWTAGPPPRRMEWGLAAILSSRPRPTTIERKVGVVDRGRLLRIGVWESGGAVDRVDGGVRVD